MMKKIVVVDDQPVLASIYRSKFVAEGFHVEIATNGEAALDIIQHTRPDLVLLDLMLPKIKGVDVLRALRANDSFKSLPIVVFSSSAQPGLLEEAWAAGATMVLSKSRTSPKQLVETVVRALGEKPADDPSLDMQPATVKPIQSKRFNGLQQKQILLIEVNAEVRAVLASVLSREGFRITNADGSAHALMLTEVTHFDLVMINQRLCLEPVDRFCQQVRRRHPNLPVVMYSMRATATDTKRAIAEGVSQFITTAEQFLHVGALADALIKASSEAA